MSEYIATGEPVSSGSLVRTSDTGLSSASIRAVFADLERDGLLHKPHASAGRVPTEKGLRLFVDALIATSQLPTDVRTAIEQRFAAAEPGLDAALKITGKLLAEVTGAAAVVIAAPSASWTLRDLRFIAVRSDEVLAVIVSSTGAVQNRVLRTDSAVNATELERANNLLAPLIAGRTLAEVRAVLAEQLESERGRLDPRAHLALALGARALADTSAEVVVEGQAALIGRPEFADIDKARHTLRTLDDKERLVSLLDRTLAAPGVQVLIGAEDAAMEAGELSLVAAGFGGGSIGVIGPTRMDYPSVLPVVRHTAAILARLVRTGRES